MSMIAHWRGEGTLSHLQRITIMQSGQQHVVCANRRLSSRSIELHPRSVHACNRREMMRQRLQQE